jgi:Cdc6-like AAA superfamily ATPase
MRPPSFKKDVLDALKIFADEPDVDSNYFSFDTYSNQLYDLLKNESPAYSFAVCLNGDWGSGKTSLLRRVFDRFQKETETNDSINAIWFDAWQYERLDPVLALLQKIAFTYEKKDVTKLKGIIHSLALVSSDIVLRKTTGLGIDEVKRHFENSVKEIQTLAQTLQNLIGENGRLIVFW